MVSNLVAHFLDMRLLRLASSNRCIYSRYADDLTFSTNKKGCPKDIAVPAGTDAAGCHLWIPGEALSREISRAGFRINSNKTRLMYRPSRQDVTGLVVNDKIGIRREYRHNVRAMVNSLVKTGKFEVFGVVKRNGQEVVGKRPGSLNELGGRLGFINAIDDYNRNQGQQPYDGSIVPSRVETYRKFLVYSTFYAAEAPVVVCEGSTDNVYLTHAIRSLASDFPDLAEISQDNRIRIRVRLYKYPRSSTARILGLNDGGASVLSKFMVAYRRDVRRFNGPGLANPVIVLHDNDKGGKSIKNTIKSAFGVEFADGESFVHVYGNLYAVATPGEDSKIEDLFDDQIKATVVDGKSFWPDNKGFDREKHYGKVRFARKVVEPRAKQIDFERFRPLLANVVKVIERHKAAVVGRASIG